MGRCYLITQGVAVTDDGGGSDKIGDGWGKRIGHRAGQNLNGSKRKQPHLGPAGAIVQHATVKSGPISGAMMRQGERRSVLANCDDARRPWPGASGSSR